MKRRWLVIDIGLLAAGLALVVGWHEFFPWFLHVTGTSDEQGPWYAFWSGFGSDIGEITIAGALIDMARRAVVHHREVLAQAAQHHREKLAQDKSLHVEHMGLLGRQHQQRLDQADAHHEALKAHMSGVAADAQVNAGAGSNPASQGLTADQPSVADPPLGGERVVHPAAAASRTLRRPSRGGAT
jgi:hypothetical protein